MDNPVVLGGSAACVLSTAILAALSLGSVPPLTYGIRYNFFNKQADLETVYTCGRYFIGPWSSFLPFPANVQGIEFTNEARVQPLGARYPALHTRTKEGLALHMQVSLQYRLSHKSVGHLYKEFNRNYESMFISTIRDTLINAAAEYEANAYWKQRLAVGERMQDMVNSALEQTYAKCWGLQLLGIELPTTFDQSIVATQVQRQNISTMEFAQTFTQIRAQTAVIAAEFDKKVTVIKAHGKANYTLATRTAKARAKSKTLDTEASVFRDVKNSLKLTSEDLVEYQKFTAVQLMPNSSLYYGFDEGTQVLVKQAPLRSLGGLHDPLQTAFDGVANHGKQGDEYSDSRRLLESLRTEAKHDEL